MSVHHTTQFGNVEVAGNLHIQGEQITPGGSGIQMATAQVDADIAMTKQALLSAVPVGKKRYIFGMIFRDFNWGPEMASGAGAMEFGFNAGANEVSAGALGNIFGNVGADTNRFAGLGISLPLGIDNSPFPGGGMGIETGLAGEVFGISLVITGTGLLTVDTFYYDVDE